MKTKHMTPIEYDRLKLYLAARSAHDIDALILEIILRTGCRQEEVTGVKFSSFDFERKEVFIAAAKGSVDRSVPLDDAFLSRVKAWESRIFDHKKPLFVLWSPTITPKTQKQLIYRRFNELMRVLGMPKYTPHCLRHTFALRMLKKTDIQRVQLALGHKAITSTMRYLQFLKYEDIKKDILSAVGD